MLGRGHGVRHDAAARPTASNDPGLVALLEAKADAISFVAKSWDDHVRVALETSRGGEYRLDPRCVRAAKANCREELLDCEHFFAGYKAEPAYALGCAKAAYEEGARWWCGATPTAARCRTRSNASSARSAQRSPAAMLVSMLITIPNRRWRILCRGARRRAANPGHAERARPALRQRQSRLHHSDAEAEKVKRPQFEIGVSDEARGLIPRLPTRSTNSSTVPLTATPLMSAIARSPPRPASMRPRSSSSRPLTRTSRRSASANKRKLLVSDQAGRSNVLAELERIGFTVDKDDPGVTRLLDEVKEREAIGYAYEAADASFELLGAAFPRQGATLFRRREIRRQCRAAQQRQGRARHCEPWRW